MLLWEVYKWLGIGDKESVNMCQRLENLEMFVMNIYTTQKIYGTPSQKRFATQSRDSRHSLQPWPDVAAHLDASGG